MDLEDAQGRGFGAAQGRIDFPDLTRFVRLNQDGVRVYSQHRRCPGIAIHVPLSATHA